MRALAAIAATALLTVGVAVAAQHPSTATYRFRWVDPAGLLHYSDKLEMQAVNSGYDILNRYGVVVEHIDGAQTPAQRTAAQASAVKDADAVAAAKLQAQQDRHLLLMYPTEAAFVAGQKSRAQDADDRIRTTQSNLTSQMLSLAQLLDQAAGVSRGHHALPTELSQSIATRRQATVQQSELLASQRAALRAQQAQAPHALQRYRALRAQAKASQG